MAELNAPGPADGTIEDEMYLINLNTSKLKIDVQRHDEILQQLSNSLAIARRQNLAFMDLLCVIGGISREAFDMSLENVAIFDQKGYTDVFAHISSRQNALARRLKKAGLVVDG